MVTLCLIYDPITLYFSFIIHWFLHLFNYLNFIIIHFKSKYFDEKIDIIIHFKVSSTNIRML